MFDYEMPVIKFIMYRLFAMAMLILTGCAAYAQFYISPRPVPQSMEPKLLRDYRYGTDDKIRISALLGLSSLYHYKYLRSKDDFAKAIKYAGEARKLAETINDIPARNKAAMLQLLSFVACTRYGEAENCLNGINDTARVQLLDALVYSHFGETGGDPADPHFKRAMLLAHTAIDLALRIKDKQGELLSKNALANIHLYDNTKNVNITLDSILTALKAIKSHYTYYPHASLAGYYDRNDNYGEVLRNSEAALASIRSPQDSMAVGDIYNQLASVYRITGQNEKAIEYLKKAIDQHYQYSYSDALVVAVVDLCKPLNYLKRTREANDLLNAYQKRCPPQSPDQAMLYDRQIGRNYQALKNYRMAGIYLEKCFNILPANEKLMPYQNVDMAQFYVETKSYEKARPYLRRYFKGEKAHRTSFKSQSHMQYLAYLVDSAAADYKSAMLHLENSKLADNSYLTEQKNAALQELDVKYETKAKESQIIQLRQKAELDNAMLKQQAIFTLTNHTGKKAIGRIAIRSIGLTELVEQIFTGLEPGHAYTLALSRSENEPFNADYQVNSFAADANGKYIGQSTGLIKSISTAGGDAYKHLVLVDESTKQTELSSQ